MECARSTDFFNGSAVVTLQLFDGTLDRTFCPTFGGTDDFQVISKLVETPTVTPLALHALSLCLLVLCLVFSAASILISLYNSVSNPYQTYMGPIGIYACSSLSACLSVLTLIIFVVNVNVTSMAEDLVKLYADNIPVDLRNKSTEMGLGYYLVIPYTVFCLVAIALIYMYDHAAYTQRKEQQRPTEDAPKEIMMY
ncbi:Clarin-3 [Nibea albiflora]|uniref:Clarin-3 n=1 Tax=Nibea albiflora TaxID=240163 RepID=A0ACB7F3Y1_NIBAL|nr:Clarin-3 [Nibea albiflora]